MDAGAGAGGGQRASSRVDRRERGDGFETLRTVSTPMEIEGDVGGVVVGDRVESVDGARARVRWTGSVDGRSGRWIGLEWDDPTRGKHDGVVDGVRLFTCAARSGDDAKSRPASLVRPHKLARAQTFAEAFRARYARERDEDDDTTNDMYIRTARGHKMRVELCETTADADADADAVRKRLKLMTRAYIDHARVSSMGEPGAASACAGPLRVLGLAGSLLNSWDGVMRIAEEFPLLQALDLSGIRLHSWTGGGEKTFANLKVLVLNDSDVRWRDVCAISAHVPELEELYINGNGMSSFELDKAATSVFPKLRTLSVESNGIRKWREIEAVGHQLPRLESLHASQNALSEVLPTCAFPALKTLLMGDNELNSWTSVDALNSFPQLEDVRLSGNPIVNADASVRYEVIARVQGLKMLNGSSVSPAERKDCEIRYLRKALQKLKDFSGDIEGEKNARRENPRIDALVAVHGELVTHAATAPGSGTLASVSVELVLCLESAGRTMTKKLPKSTTVGKVKLMCSKLFKFTVSSAELFLIVDEDERVPLAPDDEPLSRFAPRNGQRVDIVLA